MTDLAVREGSPADEDLLLGLFEGAVAWLVARGQAGQWGSQPFSERPDMCERVRVMTRGDGLRIAERDGAAVGALLVGSAPDYAPPAVGPELYVRLLITARDHAGQGIGSRLLAVAAEIARSQGVSTLRVDCWAQAPSLVRWYEDQGFSRADTFDLRGWTGQVFAKDL